MNAPVWFLFKVIALKQGTEHTLATSHPDAHDTFDLVTPHPAQSLASLADKTIADAGLKASTVLFREATAG